MGTFGLSACSSSSSSSSSSQLRVEDFDLERVLKLAAKVSKLTAEFPVGVQYSVLTASGNSKKSIQNVAGLIEGITSKLQKWLVADQQYDKEILSYPFKSSSQSDDFDTLSSTIATVTMRVDRGLQHHAGGGDDQTVVKMVTTALGGGDRRRGKRDREGGGAGDSSSLVKRLRSAKTERRVQVAWAHRIDNFSYFFVPDIREKWNSSSPVSSIIRDAQSGKFPEGLLKEYKDYPKLNAQELIQKAADVSVPKLRECDFLGHPYQDEISNLSYFDEIALDEFELDLSVLHGDSSGCTPPDYRGDNTNESGRVAFPLTVVEAEKGVSRLNRSMQLRMTRIGEPVTPESYESTRLEYVSTKAEMESAIKEMQDYDMIGVDVEYHNKESYRGFVCLIQISTPKVDYIIDPFKMHDDIQLLNKITTDPNILKVFHGADWDIMWLQRDFSIYVVNLFDTYRAAKALRVPNGNSLANLLTLYCGVKVDKTFQLADWRIRPLTKPMLNYARGDTHYLIYLFACMRNQLLTKMNETDGFGKVFDPSTMMETYRGKKLLSQVLNQCKNLSLKLVSSAPRDFHKQALNIYLKNGATPLKGKIAILKHLLAWRDAQGRELDVSVGSLVSERVLFNISLKQTKTRSEMACVAGAGMSTEFFRSNIESMLRIVEHVLTSFPREEFNEVDTTPIKRSEMSVSNNVEIPRTVNDESLLVGSRPSSCMSSPKSSGAAAAAAVAACMTTSCSSLIKGESSAEWKSLSSTRVILDGGFFVYPNKNICSHHRISLRRFGGSDDNRVKELGGLDLLKWSKVAFRIA